MVENSKIRISVVSYLNSKPFIYGLRNATFKNEVDIIEDSPFVCAQKLLNGNAEVGLVPVAVLPQLKEHFLISEYCIGADGDVTSVILFSEVPLEKIKTILLDYQSLTSVLLTRILAKKFWNISPKWKETTADYEKQIVSETAGIVIGDRALKMKNKFSFEYDLSAEWKKFTNLPFVFACWVSMRELETNFLTDFNKALENGLSKINEIAKNETSIQLSEKEIKHYLTECIDYKFDQQKKIALDLFLKFSREIT